MIGWRAGLLLLLLSVSATAVPEPQEPLDIRLTPAWNGYIHPGYYTELGVRLIASRGGALELRITGGDSDIHYSAQLDADTPLAIHLPVRPRAGAPLLVQTTLSGSTPLTREVRFIPTRTPLTAVTTAEGGWHEAQQRPTDGSTPLSIDPAALPRTAQGYQPIDLVQIGEESLEHLDARQSQALAHYLGNCGHLLLRASRERAQVLRHAAGCGGRYVETTGKQRQTDAVTAGEKPFAVAVKPFGDMLRLLLPDPPRPSVQWIITILFLLYGALLLLLSRTRSAVAVPLLFALPTAASLLLSLLAGSPALPRAASWTVMEQDDRVARFNLLLHATSGAAATHSFTLPAQAALLPLLTQDEALRILLDKDWPAVVEMRADIAPFSFREYQLTGVVTAASPLRLTFESQEVTIENRSRQRSASALLAWQRRVYHVPVLTPGERWTPDDAAQLSEHSPESRILLSHTEYGSAALLLPHDLTRELLSGRQITSQGWLQVVAQAETSSE
ncbi:MAG: hypothetical protein KDI83_16375 [Gammaproteobacteria bacterium]|nr:hypothetical protein [Gammaproteobacteria bacterium]